MRRQQDLQVNLHNRYRALLSRDNSGYSTEAMLLVRWMRSQPEIRSLLDEVASVEADIEVDAWMADSMRGRWSWPTQTEEGRANLVWRLLQKFDSDEVGDIAFQVAQHFSHASNVNDMLRDMTQQVIEPLIDFLTERIGEESSVLYHLERYKARIEWFDRDDLYSQYNENTRQGELVYDTYLRKFLFDQGLSMPFTQAKGASGLTDAISDLDSDDHLIAEVKLFDNKDHGKREIAKGVNQVIQYAHDYNKTHGYLVVINLSGRPTTLPTDGDRKATVVHIEESGVRIYMLQVRALPTQSASKQGKPAPITITREDLLDPDA
jgi:hypothetical protein